MQGYEVRNGVRHEWSRIKPIVSVNVENDERRDEPEASRSQDESDTWQLNPLGQGVVASATHSTAAFTSGD
ncbi:hypothetical protein QFZ82_004628 [Streptomyces sp. V4I23]|nr:hypothetical protein [Streptomyces sp. V4I23]